MSVNINNNMKNNSVYLEENDKKMIEKACSLVGLKFASFMRNCAIKEAREIIQKNE